MAGGVSGICAYFITALLAHVLGMRKNGWLPR